MLSYCLLSRSIIEISGVDRLSFIQNLITQDINLLKKQSSLFTLLLTNKGRYLLDFFVINNNNSILIDIATADVELFLEILTRYKLRSKIEVGVVESLKIFSIFNQQHICNIVPNYSHINNNLLSNNSNNPIIIPDNRILNLGLRIISNNNNFLNNQDILNITKNYFNLTDINNISLVDLALYTRNRYILAVPETSELIKKKSIPLECNFDELNAISFNKGCYLGQEFTNASKRTLVIRKKIISFVINKEAEKINTSLKQGEEVTNEENKKVGTILGIHNDYIMSLVNIESIQKNNSLFINNIKLTPIIPYWLKQFLNINQ